MVLEPLHKIPYPKESLLTYLFGSHDGPLDDKRPLFVDAEDDSIYYTFAQYRLYAQRLAAGLQKAGLKEGDRVLLYSGNNIYFPAVLMGVIMAGGVFTGANPTYVAREVAYQLENSGASFFLANIASLETALEAAKEAGTPRENIFVFDAETKGEASQGIRHWSELLEPESIGRKFKWNDCRGEGECEKIIALNYSSGTTGRAKGVMISHRNYVSNCTMVKFLNDRRPAADRNGPDGETWLCFLPMYHAMAQTYFCVNAPRIAAKIPIMARFDFKQMLKNIEKYKVTMMMVVPPIVVMLTKDPDVRDGKHDISTVTDFGSGAAPLSRETINELEKIWNKQTGKRRYMKNGWGMTEGTCSLVLVDPGNSKPPQGVGEPGPNVYAKFMNEEGTSEVKLGEPGELWIKAPNVMMGYWKNEEATKETLTKDGWLKTGDVAQYINGFVHIVDRRKELIKVKGNQVAPAELEALLLEHPAVQDAGVIGVPHEGDEAPRAYIVLAPGEKASAKDIADFISKKVTPTKRLAGGVRFTDIIPKNPSGKILRKFLREKAKEEDEGQPQSKL